MSKKRAKPKAKLEYVLTGGKKKVRFDTLEETYQYLLRECSDDYADLHDWLVKHFPGEKGSAKDRSVRLLGTLKSSLAELGRLRALDDERLAEMKADHDAYMAKMGRWDKITEWFIWGTVGFVGGTLLSLVIY